jgi:Holliday junction resolvase RusA-like endonuclease
MSDEREGFFQLWGEIPGRVTPKARPRFDPRSRRAYTQANYKDWLEMAAQTVALDMRHAEPATGPAILRVAFNATGVEWGLENTYVGERRYHQGDLDNLVGSVMDALQKGGAIKNDSLIRRIDAILP